MPHGRGPTSIEPTTRSPVVSTTYTIRLRPVDTYRCLPSRATTVPMGRIPSPRRIVFVTASRAVSITERVPPFSDGTYAREPSGRNATDRGRGPTSIDFTTL